jgi:hypothetical protein
MAPSGVGAEGMFLLDQRLRPALKGRCERSRLYKVLEACLQYAVTSHVRQ